MAVGFSSYEIARSGLFVNERGLFVTGHNLSNVNTSGYVRQQAVIATAQYITEPSKYGILQYGLGADIQQIRQIRHTFLDNIYRQENTTLGYWEARNKTFEDIQAILGEPMSSGLQSVMNQFWDSWQELSKEPDSLTVRALVRQRAEALVHHFNHLGAQLDKLQTDLNSEVRVRIEEVNQITEQIAKLNLAILRNEVSGDTANDYRDQRNTLVDRLSKLVNAEVTEMQDGQLDITVGGYILVTKGQHTRVSAGESRPGMIFNSMKLEGTDIVVPLRSGIIKGLMESRGEVPGAKGSILNGTPNTKADIVFVVDVSDSSDDAFLADLKANIASYVNELQKSGTDYNLRLITYSDNAGACQDFGTDLGGLIGAIPDTSDGSNVNNFGIDGDDTVFSVLESLEAVTDFRQDAGRYAIVFTKESINGNGGADGTDDRVVTDTEAADYISRLNSLGITASVVTGTDYFGAGDIADDTGWSAITNGTGGRLYDINTSDFASMMAGMGQDTKIDVNVEMSAIQYTDNIISDLKRRLNALLNIMAREVNYLHKSGKTLGNPPLDGQDFFVAIDSAYPIEMGNIKLNDNLSGSNGLNAIAASASGASGDNTIALKIANLRHVSVMADMEGMLSLDNYYQSIILHVGHYGLDAASITENQYKLVQSADSYRQSITGVSMDEEMSNMMKYKFAYNACSRAINVIDEMIETVIMRMGLAGR